MSKDGFWYAKTDIARSFDSVSDDIRRARQAEETKRAADAARVEAEKRAQEEKKQKPLRKCLKCGDMTTNPCK